MEKTERTEAPQQQAVPEYAVGQLRSEHDDYHLRFQRNEKDDAHAAIDAMFAFLETLRKLHPGAENLAKTFLRNSHH